jgi:hypothetical protein
MVVLSVVVWLVAGAPGRLTSVPLVSFSIMTPLRSSDRRSVVVTSSRCSGATPGVVTVVEVEDDIWANAAPDISVATIVAANKVFNIV